MKKIKTVVGLLTLVSLVACGGSGKKGEVITFSSQLDTLTQLKNGTVDVSIIDSVMAGYYTSKGDFKNDLQIIPDLVLSTEQYGIGAKKGNDSLIDKINEGLYLVAKNGTLNQIADYFGVTSSLCISGTYTSNNATDNSWDNVSMNKEKIVVGYTVFAPIAYTDEEENYSGRSFTGFDTELARAVVQALSDRYARVLKVEFEEIQWDSKEALLENGTIDLIWNGMTITEERKAGMAMSIPYLNNNQVAVINKSDASKYTNKESLKTAVIGVESGSAGEDAAKEIIG